MAEVDDDLEAMRESRLGRTRLVAWVVIIAMVIGGGGATVMALLLADSIGCRNTLMMEVSDGSFQSACS
jgi:hypothetical protein